MAMQCRWTIIDMTMRANVTIALSTLLLTVSCSSSDPQQNNSTFRDAFVECTNDDTRCAQNAFETCIQGSWQLFKACEEWCDTRMGCSEDWGQITNSYIWIANTPDGTLSKVNTQTAEEVARYSTCPQGVNCDPSRTSVNLYGDAVVTNRGATPSSVTKFAANVRGCIDRNGNGQIDTSTGSNDVYAFGEDECMLWNTELPHDDLFPSGSQGARATAWDGLEDPDTGLGGNVWVGTCNLDDISQTAYVFKIDGDTGAVDDETVVPNFSCCYGGAVDTSAGFWMIDWLSDATPILARVDMSDLTSLTTYVPCGYGITVDGQGQIWTSGRDSSNDSCVVRHNPTSGQTDRIDVPAADFLRGLAVGIERSADYVWAVDTPGTLYQIDATTLEIVDLHSFGLNMVMIGAAVDFEGYVWTVSRANNAAYKFDPITSQSTMVEVGLSPYTYSDMTGVQLRSAVVVQ